jgi:hypothetical protein
MFNPNKYQKTCCICGRVVPAYNGYSIIVRGKGSNGRVFCRQCGDGTWSYGMGNDKIIGTDKKGILESTTVGVEVELVNMDNEKFYSIRRQLGFMGFHNVNTNRNLPQSDCTVDTEIPTPIMQGLSSLSALLRNAEKRGELVCTNNRQCGAHIHVYCNDVDYIRRYYHSIFSSFQSWLDTIGADKRIEFFGSDYRNYARRVNMDICETPEHGSIVNVEHNNTLEFRLPRIVSYKQYIKVVKFWREVGCTINHFDFCKNADATTRKAKAKECGAYITQLALRYFD